MRKRLKVAFWLFVLLLLLAGISTYLRFEVPECQYVQANQAAKDVALNCANSVFIVTRSLFDGWDANRTIAAGTMIIAIFTTVLAGVARRQVKDTKILQRAYISVEPEGISTLRDDPIENRIVAHIGIHNTGRLPATDVSWTILQEYSGDKRKSNFVVDQSTVEGSNILAAGAKMTQGGPLITQIDDKTMKYIYVFGVVIYNNGFDRRCKTFFCHSYPLAMWSKITDKYGHSGFQIGPESARHHRYGNNTN